MLGLEVRNLAKYFGARKVFKGLNFSVTEHQSLVITGKNGSGKTTLLKILSGLISPSNGEVVFNSNGDLLKREEVKRILSLVAPDLNLYEELSALENLKFLSRVQGIKFDDEELKTRIEKVGLKKREDDLVSFFSSGMKQRLKYAFALINDPKILLLDEPSSNLDKEGISYLENVIYEQKKRGILILATNHKDEIRYGDQIVDLD
jgi:heme exporter protein A